MGLELLIPLVIDGNILQGLGAIIAGMAAVATFLYSYVRGRRRKEDKIVKDIRFSLWLNNLLKTILIDYNADRVAVYQFHNGEHYYTGKSLQKISCTFEQCSTNVYPKSFELQSLPIGIVSWWLNETIAGRFHFDNTDDISDTYTKAMVQQHSIKSIISKCLRNDAGIIVGVITVEWVNNEQLETEKIQNEIKHNTVDSLIQLLNRSSTYKLNER